jgi:hypothetical protein
MGNIGNYEGAICGLASNPLAGGLVGECPILVAGLLARENRILLFRR